MFGVWYSLEAILPFAALPVALAAAWVIDIAREAIRKATR